MNSLEKKLDRLINKNASLFPSPPQSIQVHPGTDHLWYFRPSMHNWNDPNHGYLLSYVLTNPSLHCEICNCKFQIPSIPLTFFCKGILNLLLCLFKWWIWDHAININKCDKRIVSNRPERVVEKCTHL